MAAYERGRIPDKRNIDAENLRAVYDAELERADRSSFRSCPATLLDELHEAEAELMQAEHELETYALSMAKMRAGDSKPLMHDLTLAHLANPGHSPMGVITQLRDRVFNLQHKISRFSTGRESVVTMPPPKPFDEQYQRRAKTPTVENDLSLYYRQRKIESQAKAAFKAEAEVATERIRLERAEAILKKKLAEERRMKQEAAALEFDESWSKNLAAGIH